MNEDFRKSPPAPLAPKPFNVPKPFETFLSNGLKVVILEDNRLPIVSFRLAFRVGEINDPIDTRGLTSALASMLTQGTNLRTSRALAEEVERLGASLHASSSSDNTRISASALAIYGFDILKLMADVVLNPAFPEQELDLYRRNTIKSLQFQRSQADFLAHEQTAKIVYGTHPYGVISPTPAEVEKITREKLVAFHRHILVPDNAIIIAVGNINRTGLLDELNTLFGNWQKGNIEWTNFPALPVRSEKTLTIVDRPGSAQSNIVLANPAINRNHPDYFPVLVMNQILGAGASSRLFMNLREEKGYTYGAYSSFDTRRHAGAFEATAEVRTPVTGEALKEFFYELERIRTEEVLAQDLEDAKSYLTGVFPIRAETQEGLTNLIVAQQLYKLPEDYLQTYREKINGVSIADVKRVAKTYLMPDKLAIVIVGDAEEILQQAKPFAAKIDVFDTEGKPVDISKYGKATTAPTVNATGKWNLILEFQGQKLPVSLNLKQEGDQLTGSLNSMFGSGEISEGKVNGNKLKAVANTEIQGQTIELSLNATIDSDVMKGTINADNPGFPTVNFEGEKAVSN